MVTEAFTDTPAGSAAIPETGDLSAIVSAGSTNAVIRITNTGDYPCNFYYREIGETDYDLLQLNPGTSAERWIALTAPRTFEYYFDDSTIRCDVVYFMGAGVTVSTTNYTTAAKVASLLRLINSSQTRLTFSASTDPTLLEVENFILEAEDEIDRATNHAWRAASITNEYHNLSGLYTGAYRQELPVKLNHRSIRTMVSGTDKIEYWDGSSWIDMVATLTEGRANDFWLDYTHGWIFFVNTKPSYGDRGIRVTYRYGESSVPGDIQNICTLLAAAKIIASDTYKVVIPEGGNMRGIQDAATAWEKRAYDRLEKRKEILLAH